MLNSKNQNRLYPGLADKCTEFAIVGRDIWCFHDGEIYKGYDSIPEHIITMVEQDMLNNPLALDSLSKWKNLYGGDYILQYIYCRFGGVDTEPDIDADGKFHYTEYFDCGLRGKCDFEGKLCCSIQVGAGDSKSYLTKTEIEILKHVHLLDKEIADVTCKSIETVSSHLHNIRQKTGLSNKLELALFARQKGII